MSTFGIVVLVILAIFWVFLYFYSHAQAWHGTTHRKPNPLVVIGLIFSFGFILLPRYLQEVRDNERKYKDAKRNVSLDKMIEQEKNNK